MVRFAKIGQVLRTKFISPIDHKGPRRWEAIRGQLTKFRRLGDLAMETAQAGFQSEERKPDFAKKTNARPWTAPSPDGGRDGNLRGNCHMSQNEMGSLLEAARGSEQKCAFGGKEANFAEKKDPYDKLSRRSGEGCQFDRNKQRFGDKMVSLPETAKTPGGGC